MWIRFNNLQDYPSLKSVQKVPIEFEFELIILSSSVPTICVIINND